MSLSLPFEKSLYHLADCPILHFAYRDTHTNSTQNSNITFTREANQQTMQDQPRLEPVLQFYNLALYFVEYLKEDIFQRNFKDCK